MCKRSAHTAFGFCADGESKRRGLGSYRSLDFGDVERFPKRKPSGFASSTLEVPCCHFLTWDEQVVGEPLLSRSGPVLAICLASSPILRLEAIASKLVAIASSLEGH